MITKHTTELQKFLNVFFLQMAAGLVANELEGENALSIDVPNPSGGFSNVYEVWESKEIPNLFDIYVTVSIPQTRDQPEDADTVWLDHARLPQGVAKLLAMREAENRVMNALETTGIALYGMDAVAF